MLLVALLNQLAVFLRWNSFLLQLFTVCYVLIAVNLGEPSGMDPAR